MINKPKSDYEEMQDWLMKMERLRFFGQSLQDAGFEYNRYRVMDMSHVKHKKLPISVSFYLDEKTMQILGFTHGLATWTFAKEAFYEQDGEVYVRHPLTIPVMTSDQFLEYLIGMVRTMAMEILKGLDKRTF